jgi:hypothetical protein
MFPFMWVGRTDLWYIQGYLEMVADVMMQPALRSLDMIINYLG